MKKLILITCLTLFVIFNCHAQEFSEKIVLIEDLGAPIGMIGNSEIQNVEDVVYTFELNDQLHFISHIDGDLNLYKYENNQVVDIGNIGKLGGIIVDVFDYNLDNLTDILGQYQIKLAEGETIFGEQTSLSNLSMEGGIYRAGDYNFDGITDFLTRDVAFSGGSFTETVYVYYFDSNQNIMSSETFFSNSELLGAQAFDLNVDGNMDYVYSQDIFGDNRLIIQMNNGDGTFTQQNIGVDNTESLIIAEDFDGDADLDLIITGFNGKDLEILHNEAGTFSEDEEFIDSERIYSIKTSDLNNDNNFDLVYLENNNFDSLNVNIAIGLGDGTFETPITIGQVKFEGVSLTNSLEQAAEDWLGLYDYNDDGNIDVFVNAILEQSFVVFENKGIMSSVNSLRNDENVSIFPNPASTVINIKLHNMPKHVELIDLNGKVQKTTLNSTQVDISNLTKGYYIIRIHGKDNTIKYGRMIKE